MRRGASRVVLQFNGKEPRKSKFFCLNENLISPVKFSKESKTRLGLSLHDIALESLEERQLLSGLFRDTGLCFQRVGLNWWALSLESVLSQ